MATDEDDPRPDSRRSGNGAALAGAGGVGVVGGYFVGAYKELGVGDLIANLPGAYAFTILVFVSFVILAMGRATIKIQKSGQWPVDGALALTGLIAVAGAVVFLHEVWIAPQVRIRAAFIPSVDHTAAPPLSPVISGGLLPGETPFDSKGQWITLSDGGSVSVNVRGLEVLLHDFDSSKLQVSKLTDHALNDAAGSGASDELGAPPP